jgi:hypothetical protein
VQVEEENNHTSSLDRTNNRSKKIVANGGIDKEMPIPSHARNRYVGLNSWFLLEIEFL